jgi:hypothetical protein
VTIGISNGTRKKKDKYQDSLSVGGIETTESIKRSRLVKYIYTKVGPRRRIENEENNETK